MTLRGSTSDDRSILSQFHDFLTRSYWWFMELLSEIELLYASRRLWAYLSLPRPFNPCIIIWWALCHILDPSRRIPLFLSCHEVIHDAVVPRDGDSPILPQSKPLRNPCSLDCTFYLEMCLFSMHSSSRCFYLSCKVFLFLCEVCGLLCEVNYLSHLCFDLSSYFSLRKSLRVPRGDKPIFRASLGTLNPFVFRNDSMSSI